MRTETLVGFAVYWDDEPLEYAHRTLISFCS